MHVRCGNLIKLCGSDSIYTDSVAYGMARFTAGSGPIYLNNVGCTGLESEILSCPTSSVLGCTHSNDASVGCRNECKWGI